MGTYLLEFHAVHTFKTCHVRMKALGQDQQTGLTLTFCQHFPSGKLTPRNMHQNAEQKEQSTFAQKHQRQTQWLSQCCLWGLICRISLHDTFKTSIHQMTFRPHRLLKVLRVLCVFSFDELSCPRLTHIIKYQNDNHHHQSFQGPKKIRVNQFQKISVLKDRSIMSGIFPCCHFLLTWLNSFFHRSPENTNCISSPL